MKKFFDFFAELAHWFDIQEPAKKAAIIFMIAVLVIGLSQCGNS